MTGFVGVMDFVGWYKVTVTSGKSLHGTIDMLGDNCDLDRCTTLLL
jgi:hypothetical protein